MSANSETVAYYLAMHHAGRDEDAFHGLIDLGEGLIPDLIVAYENSESVEVKRFILNVVSALGNSEISGFLRDALRRHEPEIWKAALDGLVLLHRAEDLEHVLITTPEEPKRSWIVEAISQC